MSLSCSTFSSPRTPKTPTMSPIAAHSSAGTAPRSLPMPAFLPRRRALLLRLLGVLIDLPAYVALALHDGGGPHQCAHRPRDTALAPYHLAQIGLRNPQPYDRGVAIGADRMDLDALRLVHQVVGKKLDQTN